QSLLSLQTLPFPKQVVWASALFASPKQASAKPASPTPNFFNAARRLTDWARLLVSSSNWLFITFHFVPDDAFYSDKRIFRLPADTRKAFERKSRRHGLFIVAQIPRASASIRQPGRVGLWPRKVVPSVRAPLS